ncbi:hypothetical protein KUTeg_016000 [Tegillarca granosa]|uniref:Parathion hydrolase-related protein n=1 Tax=Tegillarca granosa TaxID=220873 RepID=A0ABQ9EPF8_TEGGR|nr:hypothetical protein KUTeg_016000 [Tegillarca granosa]
MNGTMNSLMLPVAYSDLGILQLNSTQCIWIVISAIFRYCTGKRSPIMSRAWETGKVQTVLGTVSPDQLGVTLTHEHLYISAKALGAEYKRDKYKEFTSANIQIENLWWIHQNPTIVENTTFGIKRDVNILKSYYVETSRPGTESLTVEKMADHMTTELTQGCDSTVQENLGCPVMIHPGRSHDAPKQIIQIYQESGGSMDKLVMGHLDRTFHTKDEILEFASKGCYLEYDLFGIETSYYQLNESVDMPSDAERIQRIKSLVENGYEDKILIAHDIHTKHRMMKFGGHGYSHILINIIPQMLRRGISQATIDKILKINPARWLAYNCN